MAQFDSSISWKIQNLENFESDWKIQNLENFESKWKIFVDAFIDSEVEWKIQDVVNFQTIWKIATLITLDFPVTWARVGGDGYIVTWGIRNQNSFSVEWKNTPRSDLETKWKIQNITDTGIDWKIGVQFTPFEIAWKIKVITDLRETEWILYDGFATETEWILDGVTRRCTDISTNWAIIAVATPDNYVVSDYLGRKSGSDGKTISEIIYENKTLANIDNLTLAEILNKHIGS